MISKKFFRMVRKRLHLQEKLYVIEFAWMHAFIFLVFSCWQNFLEKTMILSMRKQHNMLGFWLMKWILFVLLWRIFVHCTNQTRILETLSLLYERFCCTHIAHILQTHKTQPLPDAKTLHMNIAYSTVHVSITSAPFFRFVLVPIMFVHRLWIV